MLQDRLQLSFAEFVDKADPHMWLLTADNLHEQAVSLRGSAKGELLIRRWPDGRSDAWDVTERATILLASFAIENAIKAYLVFENPSWISGGKLSRQLKSHRLLELRNKSKLIPYRSRYTKTLQFLEDGIESWARYPCGLDAAQSYDPPNLTADLWSDYLTLMRAYGRKLERLLRAGWNGPHGRSRSWDTNMHFLQQGTPHTHLNQKALAARLAAMM